MNNWTIPLVVAVVVGGIVGGMYLYRQADVDMAKAGLQQCMEVKQGTIDIIMVVWKRDCDKK